MEFLLFWIAFVVLIGVWANKWNRNGFGWAVLSFFISPLLAALSSWPRASTASDASPA